MGISSEKDHIAYAESKNLDASRINLNDLLKRKEEKEKTDKKTNILIISGVTSAIAVVLLIINW